MKGKTLILALALVAVLAAAGVAYSRLAGNASAQLMEPAAAEPSRVAEAPDAQPTPEEEPLEDAAPDYSAPNITLYDLEGQAVAFQEFVGKPVVLNFWASWCPPCKNEMPEFHQVWEEMGEEIQFVMVDLTDGVEETMESGLAYIQEMGYEFPVYFDLDREASYSYRVTSIPMTVFIDAQGNLVTRAVGSINRETLLQGIELISGEQEQAPGES